MKVQVINKSNKKLPKYSTIDSAGVDVRADFSRSTFPIKIYGEGECVFVGDSSTISMIRLDPGSRVLIPTGLFVAIPSGYEIQVRPRSGLAIRKGIEICNSPGTIDARN